MLQVGLEVGMVEKDEVSKDFRKQVLGYGLTTAEIVYRRPDRPCLLQTYVWQDYDMFPNFPALKGFPRVLGNKARRPAVCGHRRALQTDQACRTTRRGRCLPAALMRGRRALVDLCSHAQIAFGNLLSPPGPIHRDQNPAFSVCRRG